MGLSASSDEWCRTSDWIVEGLPWAMKIVDDTLVWANDLQTLEERVVEVLEPCKQINITIAIVMEHPRGMETSCDRTSVQGPYTWRLCRHCGGCM